MIAYAEPQRYDSEWNPHPVMKRRLVLCFLYDLKILPMHSWA